MACKSLIGVVTTMPVTVNTDGVLPLGTIVRRRTRNLDLGGNSIIISDTGSNYYLVTVSATFTVPTEGDVKLDLQQNGVTLLGATTSTSVSTANTVTRSLSFSYPIRTFNNTGIDTISVVNSGVEADFSNIIVTVTQL